MQPEFMMSNVIDLSSFKKKKTVVDDSIRITSLLEAGLNTIDITIVTLAANRVFGTSFLPSEKEAAEMGFSKLKHLKVWKEIVDNLTIFSFGNSDKAVLDYVISDRHLTFEWHEENSQSLGLSTTEDSSSLVARFLLDRIKEKTIQDNQSEDDFALSLYGCFALDAFYQACAAPFNPINLSYFSDTHRAGLVLYDPARKIDIALIAQLDTWNATEEDLLVPPKQKG